MERSAFQGDVADIASPTIGIAGIKPSRLLPRIALRSIRATPPDKFTTARAGCGNPAGLYSR
jgi:hypothetical protein